MKKTPAPITDEQAESIIRIFDSISGNDEYTLEDDTENDFPTLPDDTYESPVPDDSGAIKKAGQPAGRRAKTGSRPADAKSNTAVKVLMLFVMLIMAAWLLPSGNVMNLDVAVSSSKDRDAFFGMSSQNLLSEALKDVHVIPRKYMLELSETLTPAPDESKFEEKYDEERKNYDGKPIYYYKDDSIEVKCWREEINGEVFNFSEVWISDPSQLRRTFVDNVISKKHLDHPHNIFAKTNGVVGMTADFCAFRNFGIIMQYGKVIREVKNSILDIAVYDKNGNFSAYEDNESFYETEAFINGDIIHTFAFGPVLVDNYKVSDSPKIHMNYYHHPGELDSIYPRAAICQFDYDKHYLLCTLNYHGMNAYDFATVLQSKGVRFAYNLDGGQTATLMFHKKIINKVAYGGTRQVSDILYFATAIPNN